MTVPAAGPLFVIGLYATPALIVPGGATTTILLWGSLFPTGCTSGCPSAATEPAEMSETAAKSAPVIPAANQRRTRDCIIENPPADTATSRALHGHSVQYKRANMGWV